MAGTSQKLTVGINIPTNFLQDFNGVRYTKSLIITENYLRINLADLKQNIFMNQIQSIKKIDISLL